MPLTEGGRRADLTCPTRLLPAFLLGPKWREQEERKREQAKLAEEARKVAEYHAFFYEMYDYHHPDSPEGRQFLRKVRDLEVTPRPPVLPAPWWKLHWWWSFNHPEGTPAWKLALFEARDTLVGLAISAAILAAMILGSVILGNLLELPF